MSAHKFKILNLYKRVLTAHKCLPVDLKHFGDVYVKVEFRQHKNASEKFIPEFIRQWEEYCSNLELDAQKSEQGNKADFGRPVTLDLVENDLTGDQQVQLYELMKETTKPAPQYANVKDSTKFIKNKPK